jgi:hypothetical protein
MRDAMPPSLSFSRAERYSAYCQALDIHLSPRKSICLLVDATSVVTCRLADRETSPRMQGMKVLSFPIQNFHLFDRSLSDTSDLRPSIVTAESLHNFSSQRRSLGTNLVYVFPEACELSRDDIGKPYRFNFWDVGVVMGEAGAPIGLSIGMSKSTVVLKHRIEHRHFHLPKYEPHILMLWGWRYECLTQIRGSPISGFRIVAC